MRAYLHHIERERSERDILQHKWYYISHNENPIGNRGEGVGSFLEINGRGSLYKYLKNRDQTQQWRHWGNCWLRLDPGHVRRGTINGEEISDKISLCEIYDPYKMPCPLRRSLSTFSHQHAIELQRWILEGQEHVGANTPILDYIFTNVVQYFRVLCQQYSIFLINIRHILVENFSTNVPYITVSFFKPFLPNWAIDLQREGRGFELHKECSNLWCHGEDAKHTVAWLDWGLYIITCVRLSCKAPLTYLNNRNDPAPVPFSPTTRPQQSGADPEVYIGWMPTDRRLHGVAQIHKCFRPKNSVQ